MGKYVLVVRLANESALTEMTEKYIAGEPVLYWLLRFITQDARVDEIHVELSNSELAERIKRMEMKKVRVYSHEHDVHAENIMKEAEMFLQEPSFENIIVVKEFEGLLQFDELMAEAELLQKKNVAIGVSGVLHSRTCWSVAGDKLEKPLGGKIFTEDGFFCIYNIGQLQKGLRQIEPVLHSREWSYYRNAEDMEALMREKKMFPGFDLSQIRMFVTDSDGCLTDSGMYYSETGDELKKFSAYDGMAFRLLREAGIKTAIITGETRELIARRAEKLQVDFLEMGADNKLPVLQNICEKEHIPIRQVAYVGDDVNDLECIKYAGFGCSVSNGNDIVKRAAKYVSRRRGGDGAVREIADMILLARELV